MSGKCSNMCDKSAKCSKHATCIVVQHKPMCLCKHCYLGNGTICTADSNCKTCMTNKHCKNGQVCMNNRCEVSCTSDDVCKASQKCVQGLCKSTSRLCKTNTECNAQQVCIEGACENLFCASDTECNLDQICKNNMCVDTVCNGDLNCRSGQYCNEHGICRTKTRDPNANDDKNGGADDIAGVQRQCTTNKDCKQDETCNAGACRRSVCSGDTDCSEVEICQNGKCLPTICNGDLNCKSGQFCDEDGLCQVKVCTADIHCKKNETCESFKCVAKKVEDGKLPNDTSVRCKDTRDCRYGEVCKNGVCKSNINCKNGTCSRRDTCKFDYECENNGVCNQGLCDYICTQDYDCNPGESCKNGLCKLNTCKNSSDCPNRQVCKNNLCRNTCRKPSDCKKDVETCVNSVCTLVKCKSSIDCDTNETCRNFVCTKRPEFDEKTKLPDQKTKLPDEKTKIPDEKTKLPQDCKTNVDCANGKVCSKSRGVTSGQCVENLCFNVKCERNKICRVQNNRTSCICEHGYTITDIGELKCLDSKRECYVNADCGQLPCVQGKCVDPCVPNPCAVDKQCTVNQRKAVCLCMDKCSPSASMCFNNKGCPDDQVCSNYQCVNPCIFTTCPVDSSCYVENHVAQCSVQCPTGYRMELAGCVKGKLTLPSWWRQTNNPLSNTPKSPPT